MKRYVYVIIISFQIVSTAQSQWTQQNSQVSALLIGIAFASPSNGWIVGEGGVMLHTTNKGETWSSYGSPSYTNLNKIAFADSLHGYIVGDGNTILVTADGGTTWRYIDDGNSALSHYYGLKILNGAARAWVVGGREFNGLSSVLGMHLGYTAPQYQDYTGRCVGVDFIDEETGWVSGMNGLIMKTTNGGDSWSSLPGDLNGGYTGLNGIRFFNTEAGLAVGDSGAVIKTVDGGSHWYNKRKKDEILFSIRLYSDSIAWVVGSENTVLVSTDQGESWQQQITQATGSVTLQDVFFLDANEGWIVGSNGTILHSANAGLTKVVESETGLAEKFTLKANYPNPFNPSTTIEYEIGDASYVSMKIYDTTGREVATLVEGELPPGRYTHVWSADGFASGVYYCRLSANTGGVNHFEEQKIVLVK